MKLTFPLLTALLLTPLFALDQATLDLALEPPVLNTKYPGKHMKGSINYPDGFVSADKQWLHFAYDDARHRAVHYSAKLPPLPAK